MLAPHLRYWVTFGQIRTVPDLVLVSVGVGCTSAEGAVDDGGLMTVSNEMDMISSMCVFGVTRAARNRFDGRDSQYICEPPQPSRQSVMLKKDHTKPRW